MKANNLLTYIAALAAILPVAALAREEALRGALPPPEFIVQHREQLDLSSEQVERIQSAVQETQSSFRERREQLEAAVKQLGEVVKQSPAPVEEAVERFENVLRNENQVKLLQFRASLKVRNILTQEQLGKARQLMAERSARGEGRSPGEGRGGESEFRQRLEKKFEHLKQLGRRAFPEGEPPREFAERVRMIEQRVKSGQPQEAEEQLDELMRELSKRAGQSPQKGSQDERR